MYKFIPTPLNKIKQEFTNFRFLFQEPKRGRKDGQKKKVDLEKAYDRINWGFLKDTLNELGLNPHFVDLIMNCVSSTFMQVLWKGSAIETFKPSRGIRQGDPLSPYLFVLCVERLAHCINFAMSNKKWNPIKLRK